MKFDCGKPHIQLHVRRPRRRGNFLEWWASIATCEERGYTDNHDTASEAIAAACGLIQQFRGTASASGLADQSPSRSSNLCDPAPTSSHEPARESTSGCITMHLDRADDYFARSQESLETPEETLRRLDNLRLGPTPLPTLDGW